MLSQVLESLENKARISRTFSKLILASGNRKAQFSFQYRMQYIKWKSFVSEQFKINYIVIRIFSQEKVSIYSMLYYTTWVYGLLLLLSVCVCVCLSFFTYTHNYYSL